MVDPVTVRGRDLRALAAIVSEDRPDLPDREGLPPSLLADLMGQIRCDVVALAGFDSGRQQMWSAQLMTDSSNAMVEGLAPVHWDHYWHCQLCSYPDRTGDLRSIIKISDFYSARQWHSTGCGINRSMGVEHDLTLTLPAAPSPVSGPGRTMRLAFFRGRGSDFSERDRALLILLRPHLRQAYLDAEQRRHPVPRLTPRQWELLHLLAAGHTNTQIARRLGICEGTVRAHLGNIYDRLGVSCRTAAVTRAFPTGLPGAHRPDNGEVSWSPGPSLVAAAPSRVGTGSRFAKPIACDATAGSDLDAVPPSGTMGARGRAATGGIGLRSEEPAPISGAGAWGPACPRAASPRLAQGAYARPRAASAALTGSSPASATWPWAWPSIM